MSFAELWNRTVAYRWVRMSGGRRSLEAPLPELVSAALCRAPTRAVFELEGIAFARARAALRNGEPRGLLSGDLPEESLVLLHSGMGFGFASRLPPPLDPARFLALCAASSRPEYLPVAVEPLGLFVRLFRPRSFAPLAAELARIAPEHLALYWFGAGRSYYFRPADLLPGGLERAAARCRWEPPPERRPDALAGLAFAVAMINLGHPRAVLRLLAAATGEDEAEAVTSGVISCLLARHHTTPADPALPAFLAWRPAEPGLGEIWERRVSGPGALALTHLYPALRSAGRLADFACFQRRSEWALD